MVSSIVRLFHRWSGPRVLRRTIVSGVAGRRATQGAGTDVRVLTGESGALFEQLERLAPELFDGFLPTDRILIKLNLNTADPYPASTDPQMLRALLLALKRAGFARLHAGDCSSNPALPTRRVARATGIADAAKGLCAMVYFDEGRYLSLETGGEYLPRAAVSEAAFRYDRLIYLANVKAHRLADFSLGMKLSVGFLHPRERIALHDGHLREKVAELAACLEPDLTILDARRALITGGPSAGEVAEGNALLIGRDLLSADLAAYRLLAELRRRAGVGGGLSDDPFEMRQFARFRACREAQK